MINIYSHHLMRKIKTDSSLRFFPGSYYSDDAINEDDDDMSYHRFEYVGIRVDKNLSENPEHLHIRLVEMAYTISHEFIRFLLKSERRVMSEKITPVHTTFLRVSLDNDRVYESSVQDKENPNIIVKNPEFYKMKNPYSADLMWLPEGVKWGNLGMSQQDGLLRCQALFQKPKDMKIRIHPC